MQYHTLLVYYNNQWFIEFGDYDYKTVVEERQCSYADERCKIITTTDDQASIDKAVANLNK
tara:strand:- start:449 stop:631 length:183 start_codon:yes stop_codon:yes gene_type:complete